MKKPALKNRLLDHSNRFLIGLLIALASVHLAFEYETVRIEYKLPDIDINGADPNDEVLPPVTFQKMPEMPKPKVNPDIIDIVIDIPEPAPEEKEEEEPYDPSQYYVDNDEYGEENLDPEDHPTPIFSSQYPHTAACAGLTNQESENCSRMELGRLIRQKMEIPSILRDIGEKQGVLIEFTVNRKGEISDVEVIQSTHKSLSKSAIEAIKKLPKLMPATQNELPVEMRMKVPIVVDFSG